MSQALKEYAEQQQDFDAMSLEVINEHVSEIRPLTEDERKQREVAINEPAF
jgi:hypothetical protein